MKHLILNFSLAILACVYAASAFGFTVDTMLDAHDSDLSDNRCLTAAGRCSLRAAVEQTNAETINAPQGKEVGPRTILLPFGQFQLTLGELTIDPKDRSGISFGKEDITSERPIITAENGSRVFYVKRGSLTLSDVVLEGGAVTPGTSQAAFKGGAILADVTTSVILNRVTIQDCGHSAASAAFKGAAIYSSGILRIIESEFYRNGRPSRADDSTIEFTGFALQINSSQFRNNANPIQLIKSSNDFQSMFNTVQISDSVFTENRGVVLMASNPSLVTILRSSFIKNRGFTLLGVDGGDIQILNSVIAENEFSEFPFFSSSGSASNILLGNSIFAHNIFPNRNRPADAFSSLGHNLIQSRPDWGNFTTDSDVIVDDPGLVTPLMVLHSKVDLNSLYPLILPEGTVLTGDPVLCRLSVRRTVPVQSTLGTRCVPGVL